MANVIDDNKITRFSNATGFTKAQSLYILKKHNGNFDVALASFREFTARLINAEASSSASVAINKPKEPHGNRSDAVEAVSTEADKTTTQVTCSTAPKEVKGAGDRRSRKRGATEGPAKAQAGIGVSRQSGKDSMPGKTVDLENTIKRAAVEASEEDTDIANALPSSVQTAEENVKMDLNERQVIQYKRKSRR